MASIARVLVVAGSDSGGGAGIQADIKTLSAFGVYAATAITAVTVQNTLGVRAVHPVPPGIVRDQIACVLSDIGADAVKIGMLGDAAVTAAVAGALRDTDAPIVLDPVMIAKGGAPLLADEAVDALKALLLPRAYLVTPNAPEAARLTGLSVETPDDLVAAALAIRALGVANVLVKGGHLAGDMITDVLSGAGGTHIFRTRRIDSTSTHGTGCTLASAIAAGIAGGMALADAVERARAYVHEAIRTAPGLGHGHGPLNHMHPVSGN